MKRIINLSAFVLLTCTLLLSTAFAQAPEKMSYQAVVRDASNALVTNQAVGMQISILQGSTTGTAVYVETQIPTTNANGLVSIEIATGTGVSGNFTTIDWVNGPYFIKTETDPVGGTNYTITGTSQLLSVPYALHAKTAENITPGGNIGISYNSSDVYENNGTVTVPVGGSLAIASDTLMLDSNDVVIMWGSASLHNSSGSILSSLGITVEPPLLSAYNLQNSRTHGQTANTFRDNISIFYIYEAPSSGQYIFNLYGSNSTGSCCSSAFRYGRFQVHVFK